MRSLGETAERRTRSSLRAISDCLITFRVYIILRGEIAMDGPGIRSGGRADLRPTPICDSQRTSTEPEFERRYKGIYWRTPIAVPSGVRMVCLVSLPPRNRLPVGIARGKDALAGGHAETRPGARHGGRRLAPVATDYGYVVGAYADMEEGIIVASGVPTVTPVVRRRRSAFYLTPTRPTRRLPHPCRGGWLLRAR